MKLSRLCCALSRALGCVEHKGCQGAEVQSIQQPKAKRRQTQNNDEKCQNCVHKAQSNHHKTLKTRTAIQKRQCADPDWTQDLISHTFPNPSQRNPLRSHSTKRNQFFVKAPPPSSPQVELSDSTSHTITDAYAGKEYIIQVRPPGATDAAGRTETVRRYKLLLTSAVFI